MMARKKKCNKCGEEKNRAEFYKQVSTKDGLAPHCKVCHDKRVRQWAKEHPQKIAVGQYRKHLKAKFGLTVEQYTAMQIIQDGVCAICGCFETVTRNKKPVALAVDHDHRTGKIRALLCYRCNAVLGLIDDDPERLEKAAIYLRYHKNKR